MYLAHGVARNFQSNIKYTLRQEADQTSQPKTPKMITIWQRSKDAD